MMRSWKTTHYSELLVGTMIAFRHNGEFIYGRFEGWDWTGCAMVVRPENRWGETIEVIPSKVRHIVAFD